MEINNRFDRAIDTRFSNPAESAELIGNCTGRHPDDIRDASVFVVDTLELAWLGAQAAFENKAKPEHAFQIYDRIMQLVQGSTWGSYRKKLDDEAREFWASEGVGKDSPRMTFEDLLRQSAEVEAKHTSESGM